MHEYDVLIIGAGLSGMGIAADAASRGLSVAILDKEPHAGRASLHNIPLFSGGIRHLEQMSLGLVWRNLKEQKILQQRASTLCQWRWAHIPSHDGYYSQLQLQFAKGLYQQISQCLQHKPRMPELTPQITQPSGILYPECLIDNRRLLQANRQLALAHGAEEFKACQIQAAEQCKEGWKLSFKQAEQKYALNCKAVINATGIDALDVCEQLFSYHSRSKTDILKSYFFIVNKHEYALPCPEVIRLLPAYKNSGLYCVPINQDELLIGGLPQLDPIHPSNRDIIQEQALQRSNQILKDYQLPIMTIDSIKSAFQLDYATFYGADLHTSMDYVLDLICPDGRHPLLNILGGATSSYRLMAEQAINSLQDYLPSMKSCQTQHLPLPVQTLQRDS